MPGTTDREPVYILPAECVGRAEIVDGVIDIGGLKIPNAHGLEIVYVRRSSADLSIMEIHMAHHDGLADEEMNAQNDEAERYPLGPKEYWRSEMVGKWTTGRDNHPLTNEEFEADWEDDEDL